MKKGLVYLTLMLALVFSVQTVSPLIADASCVKQAGGHGSIVVRATAYNNGQTASEGFQVPNGYTGSITCLDLSGVSPMPNANVFRDAIQIRRINPDGKSWTTVYWRSLDGSQEYPGPLNAVRLSPGNYVYYVNVSGKAGSFAEMTLWW
jgi:hypothetical protein